MIIKAPEECVIAKPGRKKKISVNQIKPAFATGTFSSAFREREKGTQVAA